MQNYLSSILDSEKDKLHIQAGDSKISENEERVEPEKERAAGRKINNIEQEITKENREQRNERLKLEHTSAVSTQEGREGGERKVRGDTESTEDESNLDDEEGTKRALDTLEKFRKSRQIQGSERIYYFQNNGKNILDVISLIRSITKKLDTVKVLYKELSQTASPWEKFYLRQDAINNQYILRDLIKGCIQMCRQESCSLPDYTIDIINNQTLQEILDKLDLQNWSRVDEFKAFSDDFESFRVAFHEKITPSEAYKMSIFRAVKSESPPEKPPSYAEAF